MITIFWTLARLLEMHNTKNSVGKWPATRCSSNDEIPRFWLGRERHWKPAVGESDSGSGNHDLREMTQQGKQTLIRYRGSASRKETMDLALGLSIWPRTLRSSHFCWEYTVWHCQLRWGYTIWHCQLYWGVYILKQPLGEVRWWEPAGDWRIQHSDQLCRDKTPDSSVGNFIGEDIHDHLQGILRKFPEGICSE